MTPTPKVSIDTLIRALRSFPDGVTTRALAEKLGMNQQHLASRLSRQFLYGVIDRERPVKWDMHRHGYIWKAKADNA